MEIQKLQELPPILQPTYPAVPPEKGEQDYRESRMVNYFELAAPDWDKASSSVDLEWLEAVRELKVVNDQLKATRATAAIEYTRNNEKWQELQEKEENLRQSFIKFETFLIENDEKRRRARRKIIEERLLQEQRSNMLDKGKAQLQVLTDVRQKFDQKVKEYRIYEDFLNRLVSQDYKSINDIIKRHVTLLQTKDKVSAKRARDMDALDEAKIQYSKLIEEKDLQLMMLNSKLVELVVRHDRARNRALLWESTVKEIRDITEQKNRELESVRVSMWRLYKMMCARKHQPETRNKDDFEGQMAYVKKGLEELNTVVQRVEKIIGKYAYVPKRGGRHIKIDKPGEKSRKKAGAPSSSIGDASAGSSFGDAFERPAFMASAAAAQANAGTLDKSTVYLATSGSTGSGATTAKSVVSSNQRIG